MNLSIRKWRIEDKSDLAKNLNNLKVLNNLRDGLPYPYTENDAEDFSGRCYQGTKTVHLHLR